MKVRRYFAANMRSALELVRQEQGPDVLILSNRKVDGGVELLTAVGEADAELIEKFTPRPARERREEARAAAPAEAAPAAAPRAPTPVPAAPALPIVPDGALWTRQETIEQMQRELGALKSLLEQQLSGLAWHDYSQRSPLGARLLRALSEYGIAPRLARTIVAELGGTADYDEAWRQAIAALRQRIACLPDPVLRHGGHFALCGPTGVGKTTLASKLAARYALARGSHTVALVSTDEQRLGAHQQLKTFGRLVGITVRSARSFEELPEVLAELHERELVLIDMPGFAPADPGFRHSLATLYGLPTRVAPYLVMSASTDHQSLARIVGAADGLALAGCCITKIDEAATLGPALSAIAESRLPVAYLSTGQQVPDDVEAASPAVLLEQFLTMGKASPLAVDSAFIEQAFAL
ncbi:MAG: flagellar biosynthesis protein FlhF [Gammaproteobacteria bacterium]